MMKFNWRDLRRRDIPIDEVAEKIAGLGVPGLVLLVAIMVTGLAGGAGIVTALALLGGPLGMLGGIALLGVLVFIAAAISKFGFWKVFKRVLKNLKEEGKTEKEILQEIDRYPIGKGLKLKLRDYIESIESEETDEYKETGHSNSSEREQRFLGISKRLVKKDLEQLESRLNEKVDEAKKDLNNRMDKSEERLKWFIGIAVAVGCLITSGIVALIVNFVNK